MNLFFIILMVVLAAIVGYLIRWTQEFKSRPVFWCTKEDEEYPEYDMKGGDTLHVKSHILNPNVFPITVNGFSADMPGESKLPVQCIRCGQRVPATPLTIEGHDMCECELFVKPTNGNTPEYVDIYYFDQSKRRRHALRYFSPLPV